MTSDDLKVCLKMLEDFYVNQDQVVGSALADKLEEGGAELIKLFLDFFSKIQERAIDRVWKQLMEVAQLSKEKAQQLTNPDVGDVYTGEVTISSSRDPRNRSLVFENGFLVAIRPG